MKDKIKKILSAVFINRKVAEDILSSFIKHDNTTLKHTEGMDV